MTLDEMQVGLDLLAGNGILYDVIIEYPSMEELRAVIDLGNRVPSLVIDGEVFWLLLDTEYTQLPDRAEDSTDSDHSTLATSAVTSY